MSKNYDMRHFAGQLRTQLPSLPTRFKGWEGLLMKTGTTGIPARADETAGLADDVVMCAIENDGTIKSLGAKFTVYNPFSSAIQSDTYITVKVINGSQLVVDAEDCS